MALVLAVTQSFVAAYERLYSRMIDYAERLLGRHDAYDAVADALADLWIRWPSLPAEKQNDKFLFGAVCHSVSATRRRQRREDRRLVALEDAGVVYELDRGVAMAVREGDRGETMADILDAAVAALTPRRREVLLLVKEQEFTYQETAEILGVKYETVHTHVRKAIDQLRAAFARAGYDLTDPTSRQKRLPAPKRGNSND
jgi:RNA polymerase sigma-70 factor (ECF subfamily)